MNPLGPLNGKNFGTSISLWVITLDALEAYKVPAPARRIPVNPFMDDPASSNHDIRMRAEIISKDSSTVVGECQVGIMYWTCRQLVAHQTCAGCSLRAGDLLGTGTVSGATRETVGCLNEATWGGRNPIQMADGSERSYLLDGDVVRMTAFVGEGSGVGFGEVIGQLQPARPIR